MNHTQELINDFALFDDWEDRYRYLIDLGRALPQMDDSLKTEENLVRGCTSRVWMVSEIKDDHTLHFKADSDAHIVRGLIGLLDKIYQGQKISDVASIDIEQTFEAIGLHEHLSPNRRNGFFAIVDRIKNVKTMD